MFFYIAHMEYIWNFIFTYINVSVFWALVKYNSLKIGHFIYVS